MSGKRTILVVDDERLVLDYCRHVLNQGGCNVVTASSGDEALAAFKACNPDLVVLDVMMPGQNGFSVFASIRKLNSHVPIVYLTSAANEDDEVRSMNEGADDYISKYTSEKIMLSRIKRALSARGKSEGDCVSGEVDAGGIVRIGDVMVDLRRNTVKRPDMDGDVALTAVESEILRILSARRGEIISANDIRKQMFGRNLTAADVTFRSQLSRLKAKLGTGGKYISTIRSLGYKLVKE